MDALQDFVYRHPKLFVLTGAGLSTDSGIPAYRDAEGRWARVPPIHFGDFVRDERARRRYWQRSMSGWPPLAAARPNAAHDALARLESMGYAQQTVTQNVDGLHQRAGTSQLIELHGNAHHVTCLACGAMHTREAVQQMLQSQNAHGVTSFSHPAPDGDADVEADSTPFRIPACERCGGTLKPDVVFFGEAVPKPRVDAARRALEAADAVLVVASSLMVYSGYRFCVWATELGKPVAAVNLGRTRADALLALKIEAPCSEILPALIEKLGRRLQ